MLESRARLAVRVGMPFRRLVAIAFNEIEGQNILQTLTDFLDHKRPPPAIRDEVHLAYRIEDHSVVLPELRLSMCCSTCFATQQF